MREVPTRRKMSAQSVAKTALTISDLRASAERSGGACQSDEKTAGVMTGTAIHSRRYRSSHEGSPFAVGRSPKRQKIHGNAPPIRYGTKYHGGPVRLSAPVVSRCAVSVTRT